MDDQIFKAINGLAGRYPLVDKFMIEVSKKSNFLFIFILILISLRSLHIKKLTRQTILSIVFSFSICSFINLFYYKPRPFVKRRIGILIPSKLTSSFPSRHTLLAFAVSTSIFLHKRIVGSILMGFSALSGISRIWVGHHYPTDIIGSAITSSLTSFIINKRL
ncbi:undecaprenyl-diphosphatase [Anaerobacillus alkalidiazotrophicus]|uniref:Undecaprenyl-diphosphatase n=1 Tax=Anaerobacillus alkalidiazotrophicus TaxID=472963 RepID=A0A1S2M454_9BACI|nr:phosphatase PAP2 family protein [Anaerobacillus alkalidiazotrophicus]OIJ19290.1 undecaprenyl-diphosphatase [Anaerobacillus alkalidiazotrophicus]